MGQDFLVILYSVPFRHLLRDVGPEAADVNLHLNAVLQQPALDAQGHLVKILLECLRCELMDPDLKDPNICIYGNQTQASARMIKLRISIN